MMYVLEWRTVSALTRGLFWCLFPELRSNSGNKYQNNTRVSAETVRHESTYIILFLSRHNESINDDKNDNLFTLSRASLVQFSFYWWRHNQLLMTSQWPDNCDTITWIVISNSLDIDFIHGNIHGRSCKKNLSSTHWGLGPLLLSCISNYIRYNVWDELTYPFPNVSQTSAVQCIKVWEWKSNFISHFVDMWLLIYAGI